MSSFWRVPLLPKVEVFSDAPTKTVQSVPDVTNPPSITCTRASPYTKRVITLTSSVILPASSSGIYIRASVIQCSGPDSSIISSNGQNGGDGFLNSDPVYQGGDGGSGLSGGGGGGAAEGDVPQGGGSGGSNGSGGNNGSTDGIAIRGLAGGGSGDSEYAGWGGWTGFSEDGGEGGTGGGPGDYEITDITITGSGLGFFLATTSNYFTLAIGSGSDVYDVWFNVDGGNTYTHGNPLNIEIDISAGDTSDDIANTLASTLGASVSGNVVTFTNFVPGAVPDANSGPLGLQGLLITTIIQQGTDNQPGAGGGGGASAGKMAIQCDYFLPAANTIFTAMGGTGGAYAGTGINGQGGASNEIVIFCRKWNGLGLFLGASVRMYAILPDNSTLLVDTSLGAFDYTNNFPPQIPTVGVFSGHSIVYASTAPFSTDAQGFYNSTVSAPYIYGIVTANTVLGLSNGDGPWGVNILANTLSFLSGYGVIANGSAGTDANDLGGGNYQGGDGGFGAGGGGGGGSADDGTGSEATGGAGGIQTNGADGTVITTGGSTAGLGGNGPGFGAVGGNGGSSGVGGGAGGGGGGGSGDISISCISCINNEGGSVLRAIGAAGGAGIGAGLSGDSGGNGTINFYARTYDGNLTFSAGTVNLYKVTGPDGAETLTAMSNVAW